MRQRTVVISAIAVCAVAGAGFFVLHGRDNSKMRGPASVPVVVSAAKQEDFSVVVNSVGTAQASGTVDIHAQITGTVDKIGFKEGQTVKVGDLIAEIDPRPYQAALEQADATLARDQAQLGNTQRDLNRFLELGEKGFASTQQIETQRSAVAQLQATLKNDTAVIAKARTDLSYTRITAPIAGVTGIRGIDAGNIIHPTDTKVIVTITQIEPIAVLFTLPASNLSGVQAHMSERPLNAAAYDQDDNTLLGEGTLTVVDNQVDPKTGGVRMKATFPNADHKLWPGAFINVHLETEVKHGAVTIPSVAVQHGIDGVFVYVVNEQSVAQHRPVTLGAVSGDTTLIEKGLSAGERVISDGYARLAEGTKVRVVPGGSLNDNPAANSNGTGGQAPPA